MLQLLRRFRRYLVIFLLLGGLLLLRGITGVGSGEKLVLLTFDDGPDPSYTPEVLATLKSYDIRALFFVVGQQAAAYPELLRQEAAAGHTLGNHTYTHENISGRGQSWLQEQVACTSDVIAAAIGKRVSYFRPPRGKYGLREHRLLEEMGQAVLMWDYGLEKASIREPRDLERYLLRRIRPQDQHLVLLLHDGDPDGRHPRYSTVQALPLLIAALRARGYDFVDPATSAGRAFIADYAARHPKVNVY